MSTKITPRIKPATKAVPKLPPPGYFARALAEFKSAWRGERPGMGAWCTTYWPFPVTAFVLAVVAVGWVMTPGPPPVQDRFKEKLEPNSNWSEIRWLQAEPKKDGGTYVVLATYTQKFRCKARMVGGTVSVQFYRPGGLRSNGTEVSRPVATYDLGDDGALRAGAANTESLGQAAQELIDALRPGAR
jgi:hypothetical protein